MPQQYGPTYSVGYLIFCVLYNVMPVEHSSGHVLPSPTHARALAEIIILISASHSTGKDRGGRPRKRGPGYAMTGLYKLAPFWIMVNATGA